MGSTPSSARNQISPPKKAPELAPDPLQLKMLLIYLIPTPYNSQSLTLMKLKGDVVNGFDYIVQ